MSKSTSIDDWESYCMFSSGSVFHPPGEYDVDRERTSSSQVLELSKAFAAAKSTTSPVMKDMEYAVNPMNGTAMRPKQKHEAE